jgi:hypothetical protein
MSTVNRTYENFINAWMDDIQRWGVLLSLAPDEESRQYYLANFTRSITVFQTELIRMPFVTYLPWEIQTSSDYIFAENFWSVDNDDITTEDNEEKLDQ